QRLDGTPHGHSRDANGITELAFGRQCVADLDNAVADLAADQLGKLQIKRRRAADVEPCLDELQHQAAPSSASARRRLPSWRFSNAAASPGPKPSRASVASLMPPSASCSALAAAFSPQRVMRITMSSARLLNLALATCMLTIMPR